VEAAERRRRVHRVGVARQARLKLRRDAAERERLKRLAAGERLQRNR